MPQDRSRTREDASLVTAWPGSRSGHGWTEWRSSPWDTRLVAALVIVVLVSILLMVVYHNRFWAPADEGTYAHVAERILRGQVLHRDVQDAHAGNIDFVNAAAFRLFGLRMVSLRYPLALLTVIQAGLIAFVIKPGGVATALIGGLVITSLSFVQYLNPTANWYCLFLAVATIAWLAWNPTGLRWPHIVTGFLVGTTFLFRQLSGVFLASGVLVYLLLQSPRPGAGSGRWLARAVLAVIAIGNAWYILRTTDPVGWLLFGVWPVALVLWACARTRRSDREVLALLGDLLLGGLISAAPLLAYYVAHGAVGDWWRDSFGTAMSFPTLGFMKRPGYLMLGILAWRGFHSGDLARIINAGLYTCLLLIAALLGVLLFRALVRRSRWSVHPLPVIATFYALVSLHYQLPIYLFYTVGLSSAAVLFLGVESKPGTRRITLAVFAAIAGVALYYQAAMPMNRYLQGTVAGEGRFPVTPLPSPVAGIYVDAADARLYQSLIQLIDRETQPDDTIFVLPTNAELYFLGRRANPFRFYNTALGIRSTAELDSVLQVIRCHPPRLVFYDSTDKYNTPASVRIAGTLARQYQKLAAVPPFEVFKANRALSVVDENHGCPQ